MICKTLKQELSHVLKKLESVAHCLGHGGYNHEVVCHVPAMVEIAQNYAIMLSDIDNAHPILTVSPHITVPVNMEVVDLPSMDDVREALKLKGDSND